MANASCWAVVKAKGAPVEEVQACAAACASWLMLHGFFTNPFDDGYGPTVPPPDVITRLLPSVDDDGQQKARAVRGVLVWLDWHVLPAVDDRREADRRRLRDSAPRDLGPDPAAAAELIYGTAEELLAAQVRSVDLVRLWEQGEDPFQVIDAQLEDFFRRLSP